MTHEGSSRAVSRRERWRVLSAAFLGFMVDRGSRHSFSVFFVALLGEFGWSRAVTAGAYSLFELILSAASPLAGACTERLGVRTTLGAGALLTAGGLFLLAGTTTKWEFYLYFGVVYGLGTTLIGTTPLVTLLAGWVRERRGFAHGVAFAGGGLGVFAFLPLAQIAVGQFGWRASYRALALLILAAIFLGIFLLPRQPRAAGSRPAAGREGEAGAAHPAGARSEGQTLRGAMRTVAFWAFFANRFFTPFALLTLFAHQVAAAVDVGFSPLFAAWIFGLAGFIGIFGIFFWGAASDWMGRVGAITFTYALVIVAVSFLLWTRDPSESWKLYVYAIFLGFGLGGRGVIFSVMAAELFGGAQFGLIFGTLNVALGLGGALGPWLGGLFHDLTGSYTLTFSLVLIFTVLSCACIWVAALAHRASAPGWGARP